MSLRNLLIILIILALIGGGVLLINQNNQNKPQKNQEIDVTDTTQSVISNMKLTSNVFTNNQPIPAKYTCEGINLNPPLTITGVPENTKSLALIMDDPDAPMGTWAHWTVWNIDPKTSEIAENSVPINSVQGTTSFGKPGYGGPCPPSGTHRYFFKLYALDTILTIPSSSKKEELEKTFAGHVLDKTELIGLYSRK